MGLDRGAPDFWARIAAVVLSLIGIGVTGYLVWERYHGNAPVCALGGGCLTVQRSEWSTVAGIPVAIMGLLAYIAMLVCALVPRQLAALCSLFLSLLGVLLSAYLTYLELYRIHAICEYCVTSAILVLLLLIASGVRLKLIGDVRPAPPA